MLPQHRGLQAKLISEAAASAPKTKKCPKCGRRRQLSAFGFRTFHDRDTGKPIKAALQSYCKDCRKRKAH